MLKFLGVIVLLLGLMVNSSYALEVVSLLDVQGQADSSLLIGSDYTGKLNSQILAFYVNGILYDAGLKDGHILEQLRENKINPDDIKIIMLTHLHGDHFGGLVTPEGTKSYPNAVVFVSKPEYNYWVNELKNEAVISALNMYEVSTFIFGDEVVDGVKAIDTTGHTPGHTAFLVEDDEGKIIIAGDIMHFPEIQLPNPDVAVRYDVDPEKAIQSRKFLLDYAALKEIQIAGMHITPPGLLKLKKSGEGYEKY